MVLQQWLQPRINILVRARHAYIECSQGAQVFKLLAAKAQILVQDGVAGRQLQEFEGETEEGRRLLHNAVDAADVVDVLDYAVDDVGLVDREALLFVEVAVDDTLAHRFLHDGGWVEAVRRQRAGAAALVEEAPLIGAMGFGFAHSEVSRGGDSDGCDRQAVEVAMVLRWMGVVDPTLIFGAVAAPPNFLVAPIPGDKRLLPLQRAELY